MTRKWPFVVLGFWDKYTWLAPVPCHITGIVWLDRTVYYQDLGLQAKNGRFRVFGADIARRYR